MRLTVKHYYRPGQRWNAVKFKTWYLLSLRERRGIESPMSVEELAVWTGVNLKSLQVLVIRWRGPSWRRVLKRTLPDGRLGYVLGARGRQWLVDCELFIPQSIRDMWVDEIINHQQSMLERQRQWEERKRCHDDHGHRPD
jgi:hypothetical protein